VKQNALSPNEISFLGRIDPLERLKTTNHGLTENKTRSCLLSEQKYNEPFFSNKDSFGWVIRRSLKFQGQFVIH